MESIPPKSINSVRKVVLLATCIGIVLFLSGFSLQRTTAQEALNSQSGKEARIASIQKGQKIKITKSDISDMLTGKEFNEKRVVVLFKENVSIDKAKSIAKKLNSEIPAHQAVSLKKVGETRYASLSVPKGLSVETFLQKLNESNDVVFAEPSYKRTLFWTPNDPNFAQQWQLQNYSTGNYGIEMPKAWDYVDTQLDAKIGAGNNYGGSSSVIVAILDTGLAFEDRTVLKASMLPTPPVNDTYEESWDFDPVPDKPVNIWVNTGEIAGNGIDDDTNGYIDDVNGVNIDDYYNYVSMYGGHTSEDGYPDDDYGHGTHVANIIAGNTNNTVAGAGIAFGVTIMPVKIFDYLGGVWSESVIDGLAYAVENEADVINMSFGGSSASTVEEALIDQAVSLGIIPVAASGNDGNTSVQYPGGYENVIAVGASNPNGTRSSYSSYGNWIDLVAPVGVTGSGNGYQVQNYTCYDEAVSSNALPCTEDNSDPQVWYPGTGSANSFKTFSVATSQGTSFAAPQVSAVAALLKSVHSSWTFSDIQYILNNSVKDVGNSGFDSETGYGILNANNAIQSMKDDGIEGELLIWNTWNGDFQKKSNEGIDQVEFNGRLYQALRDLDTSQILIRSSDDGVFDNEQGEQWSNSLNGSSQSGPTLTVYNNKLYVSIRGNSTNRVLTKSMTTLGVWDFDWNHGGGYTASSVGIASFNGRLYQAVKGLSGNQIYMRSSSDGIFDNESDEAWTMINGTTRNGIELETFSGRLYMSVSGETTNSVFIRSTADGTFTLSDPTETWKDYGGKTRAKPTLSTFNGVLYQSVTGNLQPVIYNRITRDGSVWSSWSTGPGTTGSSPIIGGFSVTGIIYQTVTGYSSSYLYSRNTY